MNTMRLAISFGLLAVASGTAAAQLRTFPAASPPPTIQPILPSNQPPILSSSLPPILPSPAIYPTTVPAQSNVFARPYFTGAYFGGYFPYAFYDPSYDSYYGRYDYGSPGYNALNYNFNYESAYALPEPQGTPRNNALPPPVATDPTIARLQLNVPGGSKVTVNGKDYDVSGSRTFDSPQLRPGDNYAFDVKVVWKEGGKQVEQKSKLNVRAGDTQSLQYIALPADTASGSR